ncbi:MAG: hypothetical protein ACOCYO_03800 [Bacteroidota bacterium]
MDGNKKMESIREIFEKEYQNIENHKSFSLNADMPLEEIKKNYKELIYEYELLLRDAVKLTHISDVTQNKLLRAKEKIEKLNDKLSESEKNVRELNTILMFYIKSTDK